MKKFTLDSIPQGEGVDWLYNGVDCMVTLEVFEQLERDLSEAPENVQETYHDTMRKLGPTMLMGLRGIKVDVRRRNIEIFKLEKTQRKLENHFNFLCKEMFGQTFSAGSPKQISELLYDYLGLPGKGTAKPRLIKLSERSYARPFISHVIALRDVSLQISHLNAELEHGRFHFNVNPAGTNTGRLSSRKSNFDTGGNSQNIDERHRGIFIPDDGMYAVEADLEQADSRNIGALAIIHLNDSSYLDYCESGDLHTRVAQLVYRDVEWGANPRSVADEKVLYGKSRRDIAKRSGHATNFLGSPWEIALRVGVPSHFIEGFQREYFKNLPVIPDWHEWTREQIAAFGQLTTIWGRRRDFHGRADNQTLKAALAYQAQSPTAHETDHAYLYLYNHEPWVQILNQGHDSVWFQIPKERVDDLPALIPKMELHMELPNGRDFYVPFEAYYGECFSKDEMTKVEL